MTEWLTTDSRRVLLVEVVRHLQESPREDVAYVLRLVKPEGRAQRPASSGVKEVLVVFLTDYPTRHSRCRVYREAEMPYAFDCPQAFLEQLGPTSDPHALDWRAQCWQRIRHPLQQGDLITFQVAVPGLLFLPPGTPARVSFDERGPLFEAASSSGAGQQPSRVPLWRMFPYVLLEPASPVAGEPAPIGGADKP